MHYNLYVPTIKKKKKKQIVLEIERKNNRKLTQNGINIIDVNNSYKLKRNLRTI